MLVESSETKDSEDSSDSVNSEDSEGIESDNDAGGKQLTKKITKATTEVSFNDGIEMIKEEVASLKEHIYIKRRQVNAYRELKASLTDSDLMFQINFAESYKNDQQDAIQSACFGNQCFSIFMTCSYVNVDGKIKNSNVVVVTERWEHD